MRLDHNVFMKGFKFAWHVFNMEINHIACKFHIVCTSITRISISINKSRGGVVALVCLRVLL